MATSGSISLGPRPDHPRQKRFAASTARILALTFCQLLGDSWNFAGCGVIPLAAGMVGIGVFPKGACPATCGSINGEAA
jgi:hypothetical protein